MTKKKTHKISVFALVNIILFCGCHMKTQGSDMINSYLISFAQSIENHPDKFAKMVDPEGFILLRTFLSGYGKRGEEVYEKIKPSKIPVDLEFNVVKGESPISLRTEFLQASIL